MSNLIGAVHQVGQRWLLLGHRPRGKRGSQHPLNEGGNRLVPGSLRLEAKYEYLVGSSEAMFVVVSAKTEDLYV
jgi:hypothetical protein